MTPGAIGAGEGDEQGPRSRRRRRRSWWCTSLATRRLARSATARRPRSRQRTARARGPVRSGRSAVAPPERLRRGHRGAVGLRPRCRGSPSSRVAVTTSRCAFARRASAGGRRRRSSRSSRAAATPRRHVRGRRRARRAPAVEAAIVSSSRRSASDSVGSPCGRDGRSPPRRRPSARRRRTPSVAATLGSRAYAGTSGGPTLSTAAPAARRPSRERRRAGQAGRVTRLGEDEAQRGDALRRAAGRARPTTVTGVRLAGDARDPVQRVGPTDSRRRPRRGSSEPSR